MNAHKVTTNKNVLTLSFEKAATTEIKIHHSWRYFIAGGETLQKIEAFISDFSTVDQAHADLAKEVGAKSYDGDEFVFDFNDQDMVELTGTELVDFHAQGTGNQPWQCKRIPSMPDFIVSDGRSSGGFYPDLSTQRGKEINDKRVALKERAQPLIRLASWLESRHIEIYSDLSYRGDKKSASATAYKIGGQWIVAVPVKVTFADYHSGAKPSESITEEWKVPPGSTPLAVSEYFALLEKSGIVTNTPKTPAP